MFGGAYAAMMALDLIKEAPNHTFDPHKGMEGEKVVILGAGLAGMTAAYELTKLGYNCTILEARDRVGGRCWSVRGGHQTYETEHGAQTAAFDEGLYFNAGPSRIPHHHHISMHYCKELGVPLEVYNNINEAAYFYSEGSGPLSNKKIRKKEIRYDIRGYMSELLAKAVDQGSLDLAMTQDDIDRVVHFLQADGALEPDNLYKTSARRGYKTPPGVNPGEYSDAYKLSDILSSGLMEPDFYNVAIYTAELQMSMFQAKGGMDKISEALGDRVKSMLEMSAEVTSIKNKEDGVTVSYNQGGSEKSIDASYCICTIPLPVLSYIDHNFSGNTSRAIDYATYNTTGKMGLQFKRRFWEEDEGIYGGITNTNNVIQQIFYPSNDYQTEKGVLIGYYNFGDNAAVVGEMPYKEREKLALEKGGLIHPQYHDEFESSFSVSWHKTKYNMGGWAEYNSQTRESIYEVLRKPDKNVYFAGEHMTYLNAWMAGAFESARTVVAELHSRVSGHNFTYPITKG